MVMKIRYLISYRMNGTKRRTTLAKEFKTKTEAKREIKRILAPGKFNVPGDKRTRRTSIRNTMSFGFNNPRIVKRLLNR